jgi:toxin CptA
MPSSNESLNCRIDWQPSRMLAAALAALGLLAALALMMSNLPWLLAIPFGLLAFAYGLWLARREFRTPPRVLVWKDLREPRAVFRGPLVSLTGIDKDGVRLQLNWWPDTLSDEARRRLRLASQRARIE